MEQSTRTVRSAAALLGLVLAAATSGCVTPGATAYDDTIDICYTQATHTECFRHSASEFDAEKKVFEEMLEMQSYDRDEDW